MTQVRKKNQTRYANFVLNYAETFSAGALCPACSDFAAAKCLTFHSPQLLNFYLLLLVFMTC